MGIDLFFINYMKTLSELDILYGNAEAQLGKRGVRHAIRTEFTRRREEIADLLYEGLGGENMMRLTSIPEEDREKAYKKVDLPESAKELVDSLQAWLRENDIDV